MFQRLGIVNKGEVILKTLVLSPFSGIWQHTYPETLIIKSLLKDGQKVVRLACDRDLKPQCHTMYAYGVTTSSSDQMREKVCERCTQLRDLVRDQIKVDTLSLRDKLSQEDLHQIQSLVANLSRDNFLDFSYLGVPVGRLATYETLLSNKKMSLDFSDQEWDLYKNDLRNSLKTLIVASRLIEELKIDHLVVYNSFYSVNNVVRTYCKQRNIRVTYMHAGSNFESRMLQLFVNFDSGKSFNEHVRRLWEAMKGHPNQALLYKKVTRHFQAVLSGRSVFTYSSAVNTSTKMARDFYKVPTHKKLILVAMSSYDERFAVETIGELEKFSGLLFSDQLEWFQFLIEEYGHREDLFILFRVHPREFPNRRENQTSEHARRIASIFEKLPSNMCINWPQDGFSIYDLAKEVDLVLTSWSGVGREMSLLGVPVVAYDERLLGYPSELHAIGNTPALYRAAIDQQLKKNGLTPEEVIRAFRWMILEVEYGVLNLVQWNSLNWQGQRWFGRIQRILRERKLVWIERFDFIQNEKKFDSMSQEILDYFKSDSKVFKNQYEKNRAYISFDEERALVKEQLQILLNTLFPARTPEKEKYRLFRYLTELLGQL